MIKAYKDIDGQTFHSHFFKKIIIQSHFFSNLNLNYQLISHTIDFVLYTLAEFAKSTLISYKKNNNEQDITVKNLNIV